MIGGWVGGLGKGRGGSWECRGSCAQYVDNTLWGRTHKNEDDGEDGCRVRQKPFFTPFFFLFFYKEGVTVGSRQASLVIEYLQSCLRNQTQAEKRFSIGGRADLRPGENVHACLCVYGKH